MGATARRSFVAALVAVGVVVLALALWKLRLVLALLLLAFTLAAAMRPGVEALARRGVPPAAGIALHYAGLIGALALGLWLLLPRAVAQLDAAVGDLPETRAELGREARESTGVRQDLLAGLHARLQDLPTAGELVDPAVQVTLSAAAVGLGILFTLAVAAYWIYERDRAEDLVCSLLPRGRARTVRETWNLIDLKLGAFVRGQVLLMALVGTALSLVFWAIGLPYWLLAGIFAGLVEIVPIVGPVAAGALAVGIGLTESWQVALAAGVAVVVVQTIENYVVIPRLLGRAVGLPPLVVLVAVTAAGILFGGLAVVVAIPLAAVVATLFDVLVRDVDPAEEDAPTVLFGRG